MKALKITYAGIFTLLIILSCREYVENDFPEYPEMLVVNSILIADSPIKVHVSKSHNMDTSKLQYIDDASIEIFENGELVDQLSYDSNGVYSSDWIVKAGDVYKCLVQVPGYSTIQCIDTVPEHSEFIDIQHIAFAGKSGDGSSYSSISFSFPVDREHTSFYEAKLYVQGGGGNQLTKLIDPLILSTGLPKPVFTDELVQEDSYTMTLYYHNSALRPVLLELRTLSKGYYNYLVSTYLYQQGRYPGFTGGVVPTSQLYSNIEGGLGIYASYSSISSDTIIP
ncbi:MAG: DUF4249 domain-containing protein [Bacteroidales bacterium]|nr:DUF4249 domain-containing protein [Bacteroidales bacterium]